MKKIVSLFLVLTLALALCACAAKPETPTQPAASTDSTPEASDTQKDAALETETDSAEPSEPEAPVAEPVELIVFAAASMTETLAEIGDLFMQQNPNVTLRFNFDSSGTLKTQIQEDADCDVFISAGQKQMNQLDSTASSEVNTEGLDFVLEGTRFDILENKVTLVVPDENPKALASFDDLAQGLQDGTLLLAMGNSDVPVGQYTQKILTFYGLDEKTLANAGLITYGTNVKEVTTQVSESAVDCGVIYCTDAFSAGLTIADYATAEMCGQVIYPAAVLNVSQNAETAQAFLDFCRTAEASAVFEAVGFTALS